MEGFTPSVLMMIILAVIIGFAVGCFFMKQREKIKEAKKKLHTSEQEHEEDERHDDHGREHEDDEHGLRLHARHEAHES